MELELIKRFSKDLFDKSIPSEKVVSDYMSFGIRGNDDLAEIRSKASAHIEIIRDKVDQDGGWLLPDLKVANSKNFQAGNFLDYEHLDSTNLKVPKAELKNVFVLLNSEKNEILQYFYVREGKIMSFSLLAKPGSAWFFVYN